MLNRPPPYFPQYQLTAPSENRYRRFKVMVALAIVASVFVLGGIGYALYRLAIWLLAS